MLNDNVTKRPRGRPPGTGKPDAEVLKPRTIRLADAEWSACGERIEPSVFVRRLVRAAIGK
jgi:hypothetical protein